MKHMQLSQKIQQEEETEVELVGLGLPLQGPGWTEYARVRGYVGVQVKRGRHCVHVAPLDILEKAIVHVFGHLQYLWSVINGLVHY